ncbi:MAG: hypothetical protein ACRDNK_18835 [Solirubrobacteraceae bacterium]
MWAGGGRVRRGVLCSIIVAAGCAAFGVGSAGATITQTAITSPSDPFVFALDEDTFPTPKVTVSGTTDSTKPGSDRVRLACTFNRVGSSGVSYQFIGPSIPLNSDGSFSSTMVLSPPSFDSCTLHALPFGGSITSLSRATGPFSELDFTRTFHVGGPGSSQYDYSYSASGTAGNAVYGSAGDCSLNTIGIVPASDTYWYGATWYCAATLAGDNGLNGRTNILIDGRNAYDSYAAQNAYRDSGLSQSSGQAAGFPALSSSYSRSATVSGDATISESQGLVSCADASFPATESKCGGSAGSNLGSWQGDGVSLARTVTQSANGSQETVTDTFSSTDGQAHALDLQYQSFGLGDWKFPGQADFQQYSSGDSIAVAGASQDAIYTSNASSAVNPDTTQTGALIYSTQPSSAQFNQDGALLLGYGRTVPAGGSLSISQTYITGYNTAATLAATNAILDQTQKPTVSITGPANNTIVLQNTVAVRGTASAHDNLGLKVDGQTVSVNPDGTWSTVVALNPGANTVTAVASDGPGNAAQATETVTYSPAVAPKFCVVPNVSRNRLAKAKAALKRADCRVGKVSKVRSRRYRKGTVEHASYSAGLILKSGTKVGLTEVIGKPKKHKRHGRKGPLVRLPSTARGR